MKFSEIAAKNDNELGTLITATREEISQLSIAMRTKQVPNIKQMHSLKKVVARALTEQRQRDDKKLEENHE